MTILVIITGRNTQTIKRGVNTMKELKSVETEEYVLCVFECDCSFHIGLDYSYLDQVDDIKIECPVCKKCINTKNIK